MSQHLIEIRWIAASRLKSLASCPLCLWSKGMRYSLFGGSGDANTGQPEHLVSRKVSGISNLPTNLGEMGKLSWTAQVGAIISS